MCDHKWRKVHEESLMGGSYIIGWECISCNKFVSINDLTPAGLDGIVLEKSARLIGPHGGHSRTSAGQLYKEQIINEDGQLTIIE